ncbi:MAG: hypothetical protein ACE37I_10455 [Rubinisphaera brasiliensis]|uniref:hypothetical protein n=1 Tax=Rubinisphaera brasiliensis TaxID=119 RepID=UPI003919000B
MAQAELKIAGDSEKAQQSIVALEKKIEKLEGKLKGVTQRTRQAGSAAQNSFGGKALSSVTAYASGFISLTSVIAGATKALQYHEQIKQQSAQRQRASQAGLAELAQLASTPQQMQDFVAESHLIHGQGVGKNVDEAANLVFALESAQVFDPKQRQMFVDLAANSVVGDAAMFARSSSTLRDAIGKDEAGSFIDIASKAFAASAASPSTADELLNAAGGSVGGTASRLGISDEELLGAIATVASSAGGAAQGGTQIDALFAAMEKQGGFQGLGLEGSLQKIRGMGLEGEELLQYFGRKEGLAGFDSLMKNLDNYRSTVADIQKAEQESRVFQRIALPGSVAEIDAAQAAQSREAELNSFRGELGTLRNYREAAQAVVVADEEESFSWFAGMMANAQFANPLVSDRAKIADENVQNVLRQRDPELLAKIERYLSTIADNTAKSRNFKRNED